MDELGRLTHRPSELLQTCFEGRLGFTALNSLGPAAEPADQRARFRTAITVRLTARTPKTSGPIMFPVGVDALAKCGAGRIIPVSCLWASNVPERTSGWRGQLPYIDAVHPGARTWWNTGSFRRAKDTALRNLLCTDMPRTRSGARSSSWPASCLPGWRCSPSRQSPQMGTRYDSGWPVLRRGRLVRGGRRLRLRRSPMAMEPHPHHRGQPSPHPRTRLTSTSCHTTRKNTPGPVEPRPPGATGGPADAERQPPAVASNHPAKITLDHERFRLDSLYSSTAALTVISMSHRIQAALDSFTDPTLALRQLRLFADLREVVKDLTSSQEMVGRLASISQRHDNGFDKIVLYSSPLTRMKLVLHVWRPDAPGDDNIHNHRWDFASIVLQGQLQCELYELDRSGASYLAFSYESPGKGGAYMLQPTGTCSAVKRASLSIAKLSTYSWGYPLLHRAYGTGSTRTVTLIIQGPPLQSATKVLLRATKPTGLQNPVRRLDTAELVQTLQVLDEPGVQTAWRAGAN